MRTDVAADAGQLRRYTRVCGFAAGDTVPGTYPHMVAFPPAMTLVTARDFPFPLPGLVPIGNRIEQLRPVGSGERLRYEVWAGEPYDHPKGAAFGITSECSAPSGGVLWRETSTYLSRGKPGGRGEGPAPAATHEPVGPWTGGVWELPGEIGRAYAAVSGDRNPIHLSPLTAKVFGFPRAIAHGSGRRRAAWRSWSGRTGCRTPTGWTWPSRPRCRCPRGCGSTRWRPRETDGPSCWRAARTVPVRIRTAA
ncbi:MaoC/PaaZ C-terminal domain-containing protein [Streptomyces coeruleorubidus]|uniref:MaoC/PaaZ C-terminal domain-containing protein n=1 Tax=Streptomyces coeruleorubidus TaxID=116188 RepID=UPI003828C638